MRSKNTSSLGVTATGVVTLAVGGEDCGGGRNCREGLDRDDCILVCCRDCCCLCCGCCLCTSTAGGRCNEATSSSSSTVNKSKGWESFSKSNKFDSANNWFKSFHEDSFNWWPSTEAARTKKSSRLSLPCNPKEGWFSWSSSSSSGISIISSSPYSLWVYSGNLISWRPICWEIWGKRVNPSFWILPNVNRKFLVPLQLNFPRLSPANYDYNRYEDNIMIRKE